MPAIKPHSCTVDEVTPWDGPAATADMPNDEETLRYCHAWVDGDGDPDAKESYKFPHHKTKGGPANLAAVNNARARLSGSSIPEADKAAVDRHLVKHQEDAGMHDDEKASQGKRLKTLTFAAPTGTVDQQKHIIHGVSTMQAVEALGHNLLVDAKTLDQVVQFGNEATVGIKSRFAHPGLSGDGLGRFLGRAKNFRRVDDKAIADLYLSPAAAKSPHGDLRSYTEERIESDPESCGMSCVMIGKGYWILEDGTEILATEEKPKEAINNKPILRITELCACDIVDEPAANRGGIFSAFAGTTNESASEIFKQLDEVLPKLNIKPDELPRLARQWLAGQPLPQPLSQLTTYYLNQEPDSEDAEKVSFFADAYAAARNHPQKERPMQPEDVLEVQTELAPMPQKQEPPAPSPQPPAQNLEAAAWIQAIRDQGKQMILQTSGLPAPTISRLEKGVWQTPIELKQAIDREKTYLAELEEANVIQIGPAPRGAHVGGMRNDLDQFTIAYEALMRNKRPAGGIRPLHGLRDAYMLLSGDFEMKGIFQPDQVAFANVNTSTLANITADLLNKIIIERYSMYPKWWEKLVVEEDAANLNSVKWIKLGDVGELPTVAEGAGYTELTWDDLRETTAFVKKGGYLGVTLEAVDRDDTRSLQALPGAMAQGAYLTLAKLVAAIFTDASGTGPTMSDGVVLFHADHANVGTAALNHANWVATRTAMRKHTAINSAERLGALTAPKYLLVPPDLENTGLEVLASGNEPGVADNDMNPWAEGNTREALLRNARDRVCVVDLWTDTNNWAAMADPMLHPTIGVAYRFGRVPEVFVVTNPLAGLMFTNDTMPIKVRYFLAVGAVDWRGIYKQNVT